MSIAICLVLVTENVKAKSYTFKLHFPFVLLLVWLVVRAGIVSRQEYPSNLSAPTSDLFA